MSDDLERLFREAESLKTSPDTLASASERKEFCLQVIRVHKELRRRALHHLAKYKLGVQSGAPIDRDRVLQVLEGCEMVIGAECDSTIQVAKIAADEIERGMQ